MVGLESVELHLPKIVGFKVCLFNVKLPPAKDIQEDAIRETRPLNTDEGPRWGFRDPQKHHTPPGKSAPAMAAL